MSHPIDAARDAHMREAIRLSVKSVAQGGGPFGAVIVKDGRVVGRGQNYVTRHNDPTAHAEIVAIRQASEAMQTFHLSGCELFTSCEPCPMCLGAILWARLERVWYANTREDAAAAGFDDSRFYDEVNRPASERRLAMNPLLGDVAKAAFAAWEANEDAIRY